MIRIALIITSFLMPAQLGQLSPTDAVTLDPQPTPRDQSNPNDQGSRRKPAPPKEAPLPPEFTLYAMSWDALKSYESEQLMLMLHGLYGLDNDGMSRAKDFAEKIQQERWQKTDQKSLQEWVHLVDQRSQFCSSFFAEQPESTSTAVWAQLTAKKEMREFNRKIQEFERKQPWNVMDRLPEFEQQLLPEQVAEARKNWDKRRAEVSGKLALPGLMHQGPGSRPHPVSSAGNPSPTNAPHPDKQSTPTALAAKPVTQGQTNTPSRPNGVQPRPVTPPSRTSNPPAAMGQVDSGPTRPLSEWERFVQEFIAKNELDAGQKNAALSILKDLTARAVQIQKVNEPKIASLNQGADARKKSQQLEELKRPIDDLFRELQRRLNSLLTAAQRSRITPGAARAAPARR